MMWVIMISADDQLTDVRWCVGLTTNTDAPPGVCGSLSVSLVSSSAEESSQQHLSGSSDFCYAVWSCRLTAAVMCIYWEVLVLFAEGLQFAAGMKTSGRTESLGGKSAQRNNTLDRELSYTQRSEKTWRDVRHENDKYWSDQTSPADTCTVSYTEKLSGEGGGRRLSSALHRFYPSNINDNTLKCEQVLQLTL